MSDEDCPQIKSVIKRGERSDQRECGEDKRKKRI